MERQSSIKSGRRAACWLYLSPMEGFEFTPKRYSSVASAVRDAQWYLANGYASFYRIQYINKDRV